MASVWVALVVTLVGLLGTVQAGIVPTYSSKFSTAGTLEGRKLGLVNTGFVLDYHNGPILTGKVIPTYIIWYGTWTTVQKLIVTDFIGSFAPVGTLAKSVGTPSVGYWWSITGDYKNRQHIGVSQGVKLYGQVSVGYPLGKSLTVAGSIPALVKKYTSGATKLFPSNPGAIFLVLTSQDVIVDEFCGPSCGSHATVRVSAKNLPYAWAGNPATQCPGLCAWPFAAPTFPGAPQFTPLKPPNGDVGIDGLIITLATLLAGTATNPDNTGYYQGDASYPLEAATACQGSFGSGSIQGYYPGVLLLDSHKRSYNARGIRGREFLLPALWSPLTEQCKTLPQ